MFHIRHLRSFSKIPYQNWILQALTIGLLQLPLGVKGTRANPYDSGQWGSC
jgi:hypothetical protein